MRKSALLGSWNVVRKDGKPLTATTIKAMSYILYSKTLDLSNEQLSQPDLKAIVYASISKKEFDEFYPGHAAADSVGKTPMDGVEEVPGSRTGFFARHVEREGLSTEPVHYCAGDYLFRNTGDSAMESIRWPRTLCDAASEVPIDVADRVGVPLVVKKVAPSLAWRDGKTLCSCDLLSIPVATMLGRAAFDPSLLMFGVHPSQWNSRLDELMDRTELAGTLIAVRKDGEPLMPSLLFCIREYIVDKIWPLKYSSAPSAMWKKQVLTTMSKDDFHEKYAAYLLKHREASQ
ncbi:hypothetical protein EK21DRAFT_113205 [Setomelanomma holmii]|uniref:Uncharacterized protein n=1 Tax=Setomelanomma holmii TaxID=210430 RepID=A0A9P4LLF5_9PLEO|nr:hypothetical protein EK21DRAFT_113205 [Setomelanomma holmii]